jgi:hypothetical protein
MYYHITHLAPELPHSLKLKFADGKEGAIDLSRYLDFTGVFAQLSEPEFFRQVTLHPIAKTVVWPNGSDLDPKELYQTIAQQLLSE